MNYALFCYILNDNLAYEFSDKVTPEEREQNQQDWYTDFKHSGFATADDCSAKDKVVGWMREHFSECSFDTHDFALKVRNDWVVASIKPPVCLGVLVFIPEEDNHITAGMWDASGVWILLDEYRQPTSVVTHWQLMPDPPTMYDATH